MSAAAQLFALLQTSKSSSNMACVQTSPKSLASPRSLSFELRRALDVLEPYWNTSAMGCRSGACLKIVRSEIDNVESVLIERNRGPNEAKWICVDWRLQSSKRREIGAENPCATIIVVQADWRSLGRADGIPANREPRTAFVPFTVAGRR
jgi:hypothetical protein